MRTTVGTRGQWAAIGGMLLLATPVIAQQSSVNVESYGLVVSIPDTGSMIAASAFIRMRTSKAAPDTLRLDLVGMTVDSVCELQVQGCARLSFRYDGRSLALAGAGTGSRALRVFYHGTPSDGLIISTNARGRRVAF